MTYDEFVSKTSKFISTKAKVSFLQIKADTPLVGTGIVDSLMLTELILYVEDTLACTVDIENFKLATFESIHSIYSAYGRKP